MPVQSPSYYVNSPVSGTTYFAPMWAGCIPASTANPIATVKAWTGANGTGSGQVVTTLTAIVYDATTSTAKTTFNASSASTATAQGTGGWGASGDWCKPAGKWSGGTAPGSLEMYLTYTGTTWTPTTPSFSPAAGGVGTSVTLTGTMFTDATICRLNGVNASFSVVNDTTITATVPAGATTGVWTVGNPTGSTNSSSNFSVANAYVYRSGVWTSGSVLIERSGVQTNAQGVFIYRSGVWTSAQ